MRDFLKKIISKFTSNPTASNATDSTIANNIPNSSHVPSTTNFPNVPSSNNPLPIMSTTGMNGAVVSWSPRQQNIYGEDELFDHLQLIPLIRRSSSTQASLSTAQVSGPNLSAFPSSPGLLSYYSNSQHLNYLNNGIIPENVSWALSQINTSNAVSNQVAAQLARPSLENSTESLVSRENFESRVILPPSPVKPVYLTDDQFIHLCAGGTLINITRKGELTADIILLQNIFRGAPGKNLTNLQYLTANLQLFKVRLDFRNNMPEDLLNRLSPEDIERLSSIVLPTDISLFHEIYGMAKINAQQVSQLSFTGNIRHSQGSLTPSGYYNNSGNACPDYMLTLNQPVGEYTHMGVDFKFTKHGRGNYDIVKGCSDNFEFHTKRANNNLQKNLEQVLKNQELSEQDQEIANAIIANVQENNANYAVHQDAQKYILDSNGIRENYSDFLIRKKLGVNLITPISVKHTVIKDEVTSQFAAEFNNNYLSENSPLVKFLQNNQGKYEANVDTKKILLDYANYMFENFS